LKAGVARDVKLEGPSATLSFDAAGNIACACALR
jgi:hypothetical protein